MERYVRIEDEEGRAVLAERRDGRYRSVGVPERFERLAPEIIAPADPGRDLGPVEESSLCPPTDPSKIVCVGRNYRSHAEELGNQLPEEPLVFLKPPSALIPSGATIELPEASREVHHEAELALVVGRRASGIEPEEAPRHVAGYTCANDVTARDIQRRESAFSRAKGYDTFCPAGPAIVSADDFNPDDHGLTCRVGDEIRQRATFDDFVFTVPDILAFVSDIMTLHPGDLVLTGTPSGVGPIADGDEVEVAIEPVGVLSNPVAGD